MILGRIRSVKDERDGTELIEDSLSGTTTLVLDDVSSWTEEEGDSIFIGEDDNPDQEEADYDGYDEDTGELFLVSGTLSDWPAGTLVVPVNGSEDRYAQIWIAGQEEEEETEPVMVKIPNNLIDRYPTGLRGSDDQEWVTVEEINDEWTITDYPGTVPAVQGEFIVRDSFPEPPSDGLIPELSPVPLVLGGTGYLAVKWDKVFNADLVTYEVHISTTEDFTPDATTLYGEMTGTLMFIREMPNGDPLDYDSIYWVRTIAKDFDGSAAASDNVSGALVHITSPDIAVDAIIASHILSGEITTDKLAVGAVTADRLAAEIIMAGTIIASLTQTDTGKRVRISYEQGIEVYGPAPDSILLAHLPSGGDSDPFIHGNLIADSLTVQDFMSVKGVNNILDLAAKLTLKGASGISDPVIPPSLIVGYESIDLVNISGATYRNGVKYDSAGLSGTPSFFVGNLSPYPRGLDEITADGVTEKRTLLRNVGATGRLCETYGGVRAGSYIYTLQRAPSNQTWWIVKFLQSNGDFVSENDITSALPNTAIVGSIEYDGTDLCITNHLNNGNVHITRFLTSDMTKRDSFSTSITTSNEVAQDLAYLSSKMYVVLRNKSTGISRVKVVNWPNTTLSSADDFPLSSDIGGLVYDGTQFRHMPRTVPAEGTNKLYKNTNWIPDESTTTYYVRYTQTDDPVTKETLLSPMTSLLKSAVKRTRLQITTPPFSSPVEGDRIYIGQGNSEPATTAYKLQNTDTSTQTYLTTFNSGGAAPPTSNNFSGGIPAELASESGGFQVLGDGTGAWPFLTDNIGEVPTGSIFSWVAAIAPTGFLLTDGTSTPVKAYFDLYGILSGQPNAPPNQGTYPASGSLLAALGSTGNQKTLTAATRSGTDATFTTSSSHGFTTGDYVVIKSVTPSGYNGLWVITSTPTSTTFHATLASDPGGSGTAFGTAATQFTMVDLRQRWIFGSGNSPGTSSSTGLNLGELFGSIDTIPQTSSAPHEKGTGSAVAARQDHDHEYNPRSMALPYIIKT